MADTIASAKLWGGRFRQKTAQSVEAFTASVHFDARLALFDIQGSQAHARMLARQKIISDAENMAIQNGLAAIREEIEAGSFVFLPELEDVHMNIEKALADRIGPAGEKLHAGRSRNDQIALDLRLFLRDEIRRMDELLCLTQQNLLTLAEENKDLIMPGYTHLQRAQPVLVAHHLLAYFEMFDRDRGRMEDCRKRANLLPLGAAALAGSGLPLDREWVAVELGFDGVSANSMDTVADRDFIVEFLAAAALVQTHLSRMAEELILWASEEFGFIAIADSHCTGSSIMPQKKNPDVAELIRGKTGRVYGNLMALLTLIKGLPLTYNRDLQEDKEPLFDTVDTVAACLIMAADILAHMRFLPERITPSLAGGFMTATDLADYLVTKGVPFRRAHAVVGGIVARAVEENRTLSELSLSTFKEFAAEIEDDVYPLLTVRGSVDSRQTTGGTSGRRVAEALDRARKKLLTTLPSGQS